MDELDVTGLPPPTVPSSRPMPLPLSVAMSSSEAPFSWYGNHHSHGVLMTLLH